MSSDLTKLALPHVAKLHAYTPGLQPTAPGWVKLNTNECPYPPSPRVAEALVREIGADGASLRLYPNPKSSPLRAAIARHHGHGLDEANVIVGNGSDDILNLLVRAFVSADGCRAGSPDPAATAGSAGSAVNLTALGAHTPGNHTPGEHGQVARATAAAGSGDPALHSAPSAPALTSDLGITFPSYSLYPVLVEIQDGRTSVIEFDRAMTLPLDRIAASTARAFFLTSPNAPTGVAFANADLERILTRFRGLLVVDEAYAPFAREDAVPLLAKYPNLVVVRTLSKAYALAGIRVGYALAHPEVIDVLDRVRDSYNVSRLSQAAALAAFSDQPYYDGVVKMIVATRDAFVADCTTRRGWFTYPSQTNFVFTEPKNARGESGPMVAKSAYDFLYARKVLVRYFPSHALTASFLRISVGTDDEMLVLRNTLDAWQPAPNA